ncbi:hypothetical protein JCM17844_24860 [Iodidimonas gelatinilytica]|uniref:Uncharacterized protein n=1 Tax=Iodidimonas gelatinilytica TaxID=1236966 RepID=A0A5A7MVD1_9PROT|nr:hypothetical protein [Iodidimonas gelatinilytica]GEQ98849.1 hypothetical protein JCM17844_24860 [Iodidimonas gelatinilytica]
MIISSNDGDEKSALRLAQLISSHNTYIIVDGIYMSACALYILPASDNVEIRDNSIVSFHSSVPGILESVYDSASYARFEENWIEHAKNTKKLYETRGVYFRIFYDSIKMLDVSCIEIDEFNYIRNIYLIREMWISSKKYMQDIGFKFSGYWPENNKDIEESIKIHKLGCISWIFGGSIDYIGNLEAKNGIKQCGQEINDQ